MWDGRFGGVSLFMSREGRWWLKLREGNREVAVHGASDSRSTQAAIAKFMTAMAALASRRAKIGDGYAIDVVVPPPAGDGGEVVELPRPKPPR